MRRMGLILAAWMAAATTPALGGRLIPEDTVVLGEKDFAAFGQARLTWDGTGMAFAALTTRSDGDTAAVVGRREGGRLRLDTLPGRVGRTLPLLETAPDGSVFLGVHVTGDSGRTGVRVVKLDTEGRRDWDTTFSHSEHVDLGAMAYDSLGRLVLALNYLRTPPRPMGYDYDMGYVKILAIDSRGQVVREAEVGKAPPDEEDVFGLAVAGNGSITAVGFRYRYGNYSEGFLMRMDSALEVRSMVAMKGYHGGSPIRHVAGGGGTGTEAVFAHNPVVNSFPRLVDVVAVREGGNFNTLTRMGPWQEAHFEPITGLAAFGSHCVLSTKAWFYLIDGSGAKPGEVAFNGEIGAISSRGNLLLVQGKDADGRPVLVRYRFDPTPMSLRGPRVPAGRESRAETRFRLDGKRIILREQAPARPAASPAFPGVR